MQVVVGSPSGKRYGHDEDVALWLPSGWWVTLRSQFAAAPWVAVEILNCVVHELDAITARVSGTSGAEADAITREIFATAFRGSGPNHWG
ncbi:MAG TPA: hypothetical protein VGL75_04550 [Acidothermaceae bacterium]